MAVAIGAATEIEIRLKYTDFRGQTLTKTIPLGVTTSDANIISIASSLDVLSNAHITAEVFTVRKITGLKGAAVNALERNISEIMELTFVGVDTADATKTVERSVLIPAMIAAIELIDGSPDNTNTDLVTLTGLLDSHLIYLNAVKTVVEGGLTWNESDSHHVTLADIVDTH